MLLSFIFSWIHCSFTNKDAYFEVKNSETNNVNILKVNNIHSENKVMANDIQDSSSGGLGDEKHEIINANNNNLNKGQKLFDSKDAASNSQNCLLGPTKSDKAATSKTLNNTLTDCCHKVCKTKNVKNECLTSAKEVKRGTVHKNSKYYAGSYALLTSLNKVIEEFNKSNVSNKDEKISMLMKSALNQILDISANYSEILKCSDGCEKRFLRSTIIYDLLLQEMGELEQFISLDEKEIIAHENDIIEKCNTIFLYFKTRTEFLYENTLYTALSGLINKAWIYNNNVFASRKHCTYNQNIAFTQTINYFYTLIKFVLNNIRSDGEFTETYNKIYNVYEKLIQVMNDMDENIKLRNDKNEIFINNIITRTRKLLICLCMGEEKSCYKDIEKEIKFYYRLKYKNSAKSCCNLCENIKSKLSEQSVFNSSKHALKENNSLQSCDLSVINIFEPIKKSILYKNNPEYNPLLSEESCNNLQRLKYDSKPGQAVTNPSNNNSICKSQNEYNSDKHYNNKGGYPNFFSKLRTVIRDNQTDTKSQLEKCPKFNKLIQMIIKSWKML